MITRRIFLTGIVAAPAIVRFESLMPIRYLTINPCIAMLPPSNTLDPALLAQIRKDFMRYLANELCSVQPIFNSGGDFFALKSKYSDNRFDIVPSIGEPGGGINVSDIFQGGIESYTGQGCYKSISEDNFHVDVSLRIDDKSRYITSNT